jgi:hypothetical protein
MKEPKTKIVTIAVHVLLEEADFENKLLSLGWSLEHNLSRSCDPIIYGVKTDCLAIDDYTDKLKEKHEWADKKLEEHDIIKSAVSNSKLKDV